MLNSNNERELAYVVNIDAIEFIHKKYNRFRQIVQLISQLEIVAKENNLTEITKEIVEDII